MRQMTKLKNQVDEFTIKILIMLLLVTDRTIHTHKSLIILNNTTKQTTCFYGIPHKNFITHTCFKSAHGRFTKIGYIFSTLKISLEIFQNFRVCILKQ
jgi:hypothetical protein